MEVLQFVGIDGLDEMLVEAGFARAAAILVLAEAGHRHQERRGVSGS